MQVVPRLTQVRRRPDEVRTPGRRLEGVRSIVVAREDRLGDVVLTLPAIAALRQTYLDARFSMMVRPSLVPLARMVQGVDEVLPFLPEREGLRRRLVELEADLVICVSRGASLPRAAFAARVRHRVGTGYRLFSLLFTRRVNERRRAGLRHESEYALSFAHRAGARAGPERFPLFVPEPVEAATTAWLAERGVGERFVLIHPGSGGSCPRWPAEHFVRLARALIDEQFEVVFSVGPVDAEASQAIDAGTTAVRRAACFTRGLPELTALARKAALVISNSTGPLHLAAAIGAPTLGLYAPWPTCGAARWGPYSADGWALVAEHPGARRWTRRRRRRDGARLMAALRPDQVLDYAAGLLS